MTNQVRRSTLILPVNITRFVEKAYLRGADAVMLDLEDAVPLQEKESARRLIKGALLLAGRGEPRPSYESTRIQSFCRKIFQRRFIRD
jgi:citrate lyase beta subunit